jgi:hypothetical protein
VSTPERADEPDRSWAIAGHGLGLLAGPSRAFPEHSAVRIRVELAQAHPPGSLNRLVAEHAVAESGVRAFTVPWHEGPDGWIVASNPAGENQVSWSRTLDKFRITSAPDALLTSVHVRYVLRHLTTSLLEQDLGGRAVHAVTAALGARVVAVAGATRSGKTRLVNRLIAAGLLGDVVDDDCPILCVAGAVATLVPRRYEVARSCSSDLAGLVLLCGDETGSRDVPSADARSFLERTPAAWPAPWLPVAARPPVPELPPGLPVLAVSLRAEDAYRDVAAFVSSVR